MLSVATSDKVFVRNVGGNSTYASEIYRHLSDEGVVASAISPPAALHKTLPSAVAYAVFEGIALPYLAKDHHLIHYPADTGALIRPRSGPPILATIHGVASLHVEGIRNARQERVWRHRVARLAYLADHIITVSQSSANDIMATFGVEAAKISVIRHGIDRSRFHPDVQRPSAMSEDDRPYALYLGNIEPRKNLIRLINAAAEVRARHPDFLLLVAGRPAWNAGPSMTAITHATHVRYIGPIDAAEVPRLMAHARLFCFASMYEGFGFPVLEAMACGTPVVASHAGALAEIASDNAVIVDPTSVADIARGIERLWDSASERRLYGGLGLAHASKFTWSDAAAATASVMRGLVP